jgi:hypothetical protein
VAAITHASKNTGLDKVEVDKSVVQGEDGHQWAATGEGRTSVPYDSRAGIGK